MAHMHCAMRRVLLILGPTASGKSALASALAQHSGAVIINADSMQVYADLAVLTARPSAAELSGADHRLYGVVDGAVRYSVGAWLQAALVEISKARNADRPVIVAGGTGLYFKALTEGLAAAPAAPEEVMQALLDLAAREGPGGLHARLRLLDPTGAQMLSPQDGPRLIRALSVIQSTGRPLRVWQADQGPPPLAPSEWVGLTLWPEREVLYARIEARFAGMLEAGALDEAQTFLARRLEPTLPLMKAHGLPWLAAHASGAMSLADAAARAVRDTRRYAKRQFTWMGGQAGDWARISQDGLEERISRAEAVWAGQEG
jgi:tRNA dimethylallyltransferase